jgi:hypothetical protein
VQDALLNKNQFGSNELSSSGNVCETELLKVYAMTWHPLLVNNCSRCHEVGHANQDVRVSYYGFQVKGEQRIRNNLTTTHKGINFSSNAARVNQFMPEWNEAKAVYQDCISR